MTEKHNTESGSTIYEQVEEMARGQIQKFIQDLLEEEITESY
jgi:hypothetical protein